MPEPKMTSEEIKKARAKIERAFEMGMFTEEEFKHMALDLCWKAKCDPAQREICAHDGPCCKE